MPAEIFKSLAIFKFSIEQKSSASVVQYPRHILLIYFSLICTRGIRVRSNKPNPSPKSDLTHTKAGFEPLLLHSPFSAIPLPLTRHNPQPTDFGQVSMGFRRASTCSSIQVRCTSSSIRAQTLVTVSGRFR